MKTESKQWFVMTDSGTGAFTSASFGPFNDLAYARLTVQKLFSHGLKSQVYSAEYAKDCDPIGYSNLCAKYPNGIDAE